VEVSLRLSNCCAGIIIRSQHSTLIPCPSYAQRDLAVQPVMSRSFWSTDNITVGRPVAPKIVSTLLESKPERGKSGRKNELDLGVGVVAVCEVDVCSGCCETVFDRLFDGIVGITLELGNSS
jgi:hypothetical protein